MRKRHMAMSLVPILAAVVMSFGVVAPALAAPLQLAIPSGQAQRSVAAAASLHNKIVLPDTSIDGPSLSSQGNETVLAWTGTDAAHHLNVETSTDGLHYSHKLVLDETSPFRPDVALATQGGPVAVAWTGSDANHSLNVLYDVYGSHPLKLTLTDDSSFTAPALLIGPGFFLAWTGVDPNHSLNVLQLSVTSSALVAGTKTVLSQDSSDAGPRMTRGSATVMDLLWSARGSLQLRVASATHADALEPGTAIAELSAAAPDAFLLGPFEGLGNQVWLGWTGIDAAHHLNVRSSTGFLTNAGTTTTLSDMAFGGPAVSFNTGLNENLLAWTGVDAAHHLNVAGFF